MAISGDRTGRYAYNGVNISDNSSITLSQESFESQLHKLRKSLRKDTPYPRITTDTVSVEQNMYGNVSSVGAPVSVHTNPYLTPTVTWTDPAYLNRNSMGETFAGYERVFSHEELEEVLIQILDKLILSSLDNDIRTQFMELLSPLVELCTGIDS